METHLCSLSVVLHSCSFLGKDLKETFLKDGDMGGADSYRVSCEYQLSHVCAVVLTWCWRGKGGPLDLSGVLSDSLPGDHSPLTICPKTISHCGLTV